LPEVGLELTRPEERSQHDGGQDQLRQRTGRLRSDHNGGLPAGRMLEGGPRFVGWQHVAQADGDWREGGALAADERGDPLERLGVATGDGLETLLGVGAAPILEDQRAKGPGDSIAEWGRTGGSARPI